MKLLIKQIRLYFLTKLRVHEQLFTRGVLLNGFYYPEDDGSQIRRFLFVLILKSYFYYHFHIFYNCTQTSEYQSRINFLLKIIK